MFKNKIRGAVVKATPLALAAGLLLAGCGGGGSSTSSSAPAPAPTTGSSGSVASLGITPTGIDDFWGYSVQTLVTARDSAGATVSPRPAVTLTADDGSVVSTDAATTTVNLLRPGSTTVTAAVGSVRASTTVNVRGFERLARGTYDTMCAVADGRQRIYCWGSSGTRDAAMIPTATLAFQYVAPTPIPQGAIPPGSLIKKVGVSTFNICALTDAGGVFCWGSNLRGGLGVNSAEVGRLAPTALAAGAVPAGVRFVDLTMTSLGGCVTGDDGRLYCWGDHSYIPNPTLSSAGASLAPVATALGEIGPDVKLVKVAGGGLSGCVLGDNGRAYCWSQGSNTPKLVLQGAVPTNVKLVDLQQSDDRTCALADNGQIYCWGTGFGYLFGGGLSGFVSKAPPTLVVDGAKPAGVKFTALSVGGLATASCAVADDGALYCWGKGYLGSAGDGNALDHEVPTPVRVLAGEKDAAFTWTQINCAQYACTALASDRRIYSWGSNQQRMLSREATTERSATPLLATRPTRP